MNLSTPLEEPGEYQFEVVADGQTFTCTAMIPMRRDGTDTVCSVGLFIQREAITTTSVNRVTGTVGDPIVALWVQGNFTSVSVTGRLDGADVLSADLTPQYRGVEINGEGCGECLMATHTIGG